MVSLSRIENGLGTPRFHRLEDLAEIMVSRSYSGRRSPQREAALKALLRSLPASTQEDWGIS